MKPPLHLNSGLPLHVLADCKRAAVKAEWPCGTWFEFADAARACLGAECSAEEFACFMRVVEERFEVTRGPKFSEWSPVAEATDTEAQGRTP
jgi:cytochrome P450